MKSHVNQTASKVSSGHTSQIRVPAQRKVIDVVKKNVRGESPRNSMAGDEFSPLNSDAGNGIETYGPTYEPEAASKTKKAHGRQRSPSNENNSKDGKSLSKDRSDDQDETSHIVLVSAEKVDQ